MKKKENQMTNINRAHVKEIKEKIQKKDMQEKERK